MRRRTFPKAAATTAGAAARQGTLAAMAQIGNELNGGLFWPDGDRSHWPQQADCSSPVYPRPVQSRRGPISCCT